MNNIIQPSRFVVIGLCGALVFQLSVLVGEFLVAAYPRWTGTPIRVLVEPVDPRDLFRGNYARLGYSFNRVSENLWNGGDALRSGQVVYVTLTPKTVIREEVGADDDVDSTDWVASSIALEPPMLEQPRDIRFIRGRVISHRHSRTQTVEAVQGDEGREVEVVEHPGLYEIEYGVEAWFAPKIKAQTLERELRNGAWATLYLAESGRAALVDIDTELTASDLLDDDVNE